MGNASKVVRFAGFRWEGVPLRAYKEESALYKDIARQTILGEGDGEAPLSFITRYFEVQPGGHSTLERHEHPHAVIVLRGRGTVRLGDRPYDIAPYDAVYVAPGAVHQFRAADDEPLGFLCVVTRVRDRPVPVADRP